MTLPTLGLITVVATAVVAGAGVLPESVGGNGSPERETGVDETTGELTLEEDMFEVLVC